MEAEQGCRRGIRSLIDVRCEIYDVREYYLRFGAVELLSVPNIIGLGV